MATIKLKTGNNVPPILSLGEPAFDALNHKLYIGDGIINTLIGAGNVTSVAALTLTTLGTDLTSSVANPTTTPVITLNVPTASASNRGVLSSSDWSLFSSKQAAGNYITALIGEASATGPGSVNITLNNSSVIGKVLTGLNITGGNIISTDSILTAFGKVQNQINALIGGVIYQGTWNATTNSPTLTSSIGTKGYYYKVAVAGNTNLDGITDWKIGDWVIFDGTAWQKVDNTDSVSSVNGFTGAVNLTTADISEGGGILYYNNARGIGSTLTGYSSGAGTISSSDTVLSAIQKLNGNIGAIVGGVSSVSNSDGTLTISPTTGAVVASLALGHANNWTATQTLTQNAATTIKPTSAVVFQNTTIGATSLSPPIQLMGTFTGSISKGIRMYSSNTSNVSTLNIERTVDGSTWLPALTINTNSLGYYNTAGFQTIFNTVNITAQRSVRFPDYDLTVAANPMTAIGDIIQGGTLSNSVATPVALAAVATGNVLLSGGVGTASSWGKIDLTAHVSGILPTANGGTGSSTQNFVDLTTSQTISGVKSFSSAVVSGTLAGTYGTYGDVNILWSNGTSTGSLLHATMTSSRSWTLPDASGIIPLLSTNNTFTGLNTFTTSSFTDAILVTSSAGGTSLGLNRPSNTVLGILNLKTGGAPKWALGFGGVAGTDDFTLSAQGIGAGATNYFTADWAAGNFTFTVPLVAQTISLNSTLKLAGYPVAALPAAGTAGRIAYVTDALTPSFLVIVVGGGSTKTPVFDNGTNWVVF